MPKFVKKNLTEMEATGGGVRDLITPDKRIGKLVPIDEIYPNPDQPRKHFDEEALASLAESIRQHGLINPITVNESGIILAGERRYRACRRLGMREVPVVKMNGSMEISLVENLQREELHPLEEARGYQALVDGGYTHEDIAQRIGKDRSVVSHSLRLLDLPPDIQAECVTSHNVTKDQLLQVVSASSDDERRAVWASIKEGKSARAIRRERKESAARRLTTRIFINRVRSLNEQIAALDLGHATKRDRERLRAHVTQAVTSLQAMLDHLDDHQG